MKTCLRLFAVCALALSFSTLDAVAAEKKPAAEKSATKKATFPFYGKLEAITATKLTIQSGKSSREFAIDKDTVIKKNDADATVKDAVVGQWVGGSAKKAEDGSSSVLKLNLSAKQKDDKPAAKEEAPKKKSKAKEKTE